MNGGLDPPGYSPAVIMVSAKFTPAASILITTSPGLGWGSGISRSSRTSGPPVRAATIAFIDQR